MQDGFLGVNHAETSIETWIDRNFTMLPTDTVRRLCAPESHPTASEWEALHVPAEPDPDDHEDEWSDAHPEPEDMDSPEWEKWNDAREADFDRACAEWAEQWDTGDARDFPETSNLWIGKDSEGLRDALIASGFCVFWSDALCDAMGEDCIAFGIPLGAGGGGSWLTTMWAPLRLRLAMGWARRLDFDPSDECSELAAMLAEVADRAGREDGDVIRAILRSE